MENEIIVAAFNVAYPSALISPTVCTFIMEDRLG